MVALDRKSLSFVDLFELVEFPDRLAAAKAYIADARTRGVLSIGIDHVLAFDDVQEAHRILETGRLAGKLVLPWTSGVAFADPGRRRDDYITAMRALWRGSPPVASGLIRPAAFPASQSLGGGRAQRRPRRACRPPIPADVLRAWGSPRCRSRIARGLPGT